MSIEKAIANIISTSNIRPKSMVMTIFGDIVTLYGGSMSLQKLVMIGDMLSINQYLIRTSVYRLKKDLLLDSHKKGRYSFYFLSELSKITYSQAVKQIYEYIQPNELTSWTIVFSNHIKCKKQQKKFKKELVYKGFAEIGNHVLCFPSKSIHPINLSKDLNISDEVIIFRGRLSSGTDKLFFNTLVKNIWDLETMVSLFNHFIEIFKPIKEIVTNHKQSISNAQAIQIRLLVIHEYRRLLLRVPFLPLEILPSYWPYNQAYQLCSDIYNAVYQQTNEELQNIFDCKAAKPNRFVNEL